MSEVQQIDPTLLNDGGYSPEQQVRINGGLDRIRQISSMDERFSGLGVELDEVLADDQQRVALEGALLVWAQTPFVDGSRGEDGKGTNGGVEHFFAYRMDELKAKRWDSPELSKYPPTLTGFIALSADLYESANHPEVSENTKMVYEMTDDAGNKRRFGNFSGHNQFVAFRRASEDTFLVSSLYPIREMSTIRPSLEKDVQKWTPEKEKAYLNQLTSQPTLERVR